MRRPETRRLGMRELAAAAGVSLATVDRALNGRQAVKAETRARRIAQMVEMLARGETIHIFKPKPKVEG